MNKSAQALASQKISPKATNNFPNKYEELIKKINMITLSRFYVLIRHKI